MPKMSSKKKSQSALLQDVWRRRGADAREDIEFVGDIAWSLAPLCELSPEIKAYLFKLIGSYVQSGTMLMYAGLLGQLLTSKYGLTMRNGSNKGSSLLKAKMHAKTKILEVEPELPAQLADLFAASANQTDDLEQIRLQLVGLTRLLTTLKALDGASPNSSEALLGDFKRLWDEVMQAGATRDRGSKPGALAQFVS